MKIAGEELKKKDGVAVGCARARDWRERRMRMEGNIVEETSSRSVQREEECHSLEHSTPLLRKFPQKK